jgi:hypothetical protein
MKPQARPFIVEIKRRGKKLATTAKTSSWPDLSVFRGDKKGAGLPPGPDKARADPIEVTVPSEPAHVSAGDNTEDGRLDDTADFSSRDPES